MKTVAVVMAGGRGTRFWPLSRASRPKQLLSLFGEESMLATSVRRLERLVPVEQILVITGRDIETQVREQLPTLPHENILAEPMGRNTAPCVAWAAVTAHRRFGPDSVIAVLPADHYINDQGEFESCFESAVRYAQEGNIVTLGVRPSHPETGYGYLQFGDILAPLDGAALTALQLNAFVEKPSLEDAVSYLADGQYLWNSGMFFFSTDTILREFEQQLPDILKTIQTIDSASTGPNGDQVLSELFPTCQSISIDYGIMEQAKQLVTIPASFGWSDVGNWRAMLNFRGEKSENYEVGHVISKDCSGSVLVADEGTSLITLGVQDLAVIACTDVTVVLPIEQAQQVRELVDLVAKSTRKGLLD